MRAVLLIVLFVVAAASASAQGLVPVAPDGWTAQTDASTFPDWCKTDAVVLCAVSPEGAALSVENFRVDFGAPADEALLDLILPKPKPAVTTKAYAARDVEARQATWLQDGRRWVLA